VLWLCHPCGSSVAGLPAFEQIYEPQVGARMRAFSQTSSEKDRRRFAALEATRLGPGEVVGGHGLAALGQLAFGLPDFCTGR